MSMVSWAVPGSSIARITWRNKRDTKKCWTWCQLKYHQVNLCPVPLIETDAACGFFRLPNNPAALFLVVLLYRWAKWRFREVKWLTIHFIVRGRDKLCPDSWTLTSSPCSPNGGLRYMGMEVGEEICHWFPKGEGTHRVYSMKPSATGTVGDDCWQKPPSQTKMGLSTRSDALSHAPRAEGTTNYYSLWFARSFSSGLSFESIIRFYPEV